MAYLLDRYIDGRPVDPDDVRRLERADQASDAARHVLPLGRGNVEPERDQAEVPAAAGQLLHHELMDMGFQWGPDPVTSHYATAAMTSKIFGAGVCDNYAALAALSYGAQAQRDGFEHQQDERLLLISHQRHKHLWVEVRSPEDGAPAIMMDPWREGPAVFTEDAALAGEREQLEVHLSLDLPSAAQAHEWADEFSRGFANARLKRLDHAKEHLANLPPRRPRVPPPMLDPAFAQRVQDRLAAGDVHQRVQTELVAVGLAASLGTQGIKNRIAEASKIIGEAKKLVAHAEVRSNEVNTREKAG